MRTALRLRPHHSEPASEIDSSRLRGLLARKRPRSGSVPIAPGVSRPAGCVYGIVAAATLEGTLVIPEASTLSTM